METEALGGDEDSLDQRGFFCARDRHCGEAIESEHSASNGRGELSHSWDSFVFGRRGETRGSSAGAGVETRKRERDGEREREERGGFVFFFFKSAV